HLNKMLKTIVDRIGNRLPKSDKDSGPVADVVLANDVIPEAETEPTDETGPLMQDEAPVALTEPFVIAADIEAATPIASPVHNDLTGQDYPALRAPVKSG